MSSNEELLQILNNEEVSVEEFRSKNSESIKKSIITRGLSEDASTLDKKLAYGMLGITGDKTEEEKLEQHERSMPMDKLIEKVDVIQNQFKSREVKEDIVELLQRKKHDDRSLSDLYDMLDTAYSSVPPSVNVFEDKKYLRELMRRHKQEKYLFFVPNYPCEQFIDAIAMEDIFMVLFSAANGVGKTATTVNVLANIIFGAGNKDYFNKPLYTNWKYPKKFRIVSNEKSIKTEIIPAIKEWFPQKRYRARKRGLTYESYFETDTGWIGDIMTFQQPITSFESVTLGLNWFDEPPPKDIFDATVFRMRLGGKILCTAVPLNDVASLELEERFKGGDRIYYNPKTQEEEKVKNNVIHIKGITEDACKDCGKPNSKGVKGHLEHEHIIQMAISVDKEQRDARMSGEILRGENFIFREFSRKIHVIDPFDVRNKKFCVMASLDGHPKKADALVYMAISEETGDYFVIDELGEYFRGLAALAGEINIIERGLNVIERIADPSIVQDKHNDDEVSYIDRLGRDYGIHFQKGGKRRDEADNAIIDALHYGTDESGNVVSQPKLYIFKNCERTISQMEKYVYVKSKQGIISKTKKNEDFVEALGRIVIKKPKFRLIASKDSTFLHAQVSKKKNPFATQDSGMGVSPGVGAPSLERWL